MGATTSDIIPGTRILVLPLGSWEQHGPHLPLDTDSRIIDAVVSSALALLDDGQFLLAPTMAITASDEHADFPGTISAGTTATAASIVAMARSASWARGVCIVNGHGGNADALEHVHGALSHEHVNHDIWYPEADADDDMHAGLTETSLMLHLDPSAVRQDRFSAGAPSTPETLRRMRAGGVFSVTHSGVVGDPRAATAELGARVLDRWTRSLATRLETCARKWPSVRG